MKLFFLKSFLNLIFRSILSSLSYISFSSNILTSKFLFSESSSSVLVNNPDFVSNEQLDKNKKVTNK